MSWRTGKFFVNGVDITTLADLKTTSDYGTANAFFSSGKINLLSGHKMTTQFWQTGNSSVVGANKLMVNGVSTNLAYRGQRPFRLLKVMGVQPGNANTTQTQIYNNNGVLYNIESDGSSFELGRTSAPDKVVAFHMVFWASGGKGGGGAYWFLAGNYGGVGGGSGAKMFVTFCLNPGKSIYLGFDGTTDYAGRTTDSMDRNIPSPGFFIKDNNGTEMMRLTGGYSGIASNKKNKTDDLSGWGNCTVMYDYFSFHSTCRYYLRKWSPGAKRNTTGNPGNSATFGTTNVRIGRLNYANNQIEYTDYPMTAPYEGNPENIAMGFQLTGVGGKWCNATGNSRGSGGAGGYQDGGYGGDTDNGSAGGPGGYGGGGGGAGSPACGATGGNGGEPGYMIYVEGEPINGSNSY